jgi:hypothetical protein
MTHPALPLALAAIAAPAAVAVEEPRVLVAQLTVRQRVVIRVPRIQPARLPVGRVSIAAPIVWKEGKGPKCIALSSMAGAAIDRPTLVDLVLTGGTRMRARLDGDCAPLDFYSGFYIRPSADGKVCARRDAIRVRSGASCTIKQFRVLTPQR